MTLFIAFTVGTGLKPPRCEVTITSPVPIVLGIFTIPVAILLAICILSTFRPRLQRNREHDAFVCYRFDADNDFVMDSLRPRLGTNHNLCIHSIDFVPGINIYTNILNAIESSNCAVILISNDFLDSRWCREEFEFCYRETKKDPAFKLLTILMEPLAMLNLSRQSCGLIKYYLETNTFLEHNDANLWKKIAKHFTEVRSGKNKEGKRRCENDEDEAEAFLAEDAETAF